MDYAFHISVTGPFQILRGVYSFILIIFTFLFKILANSDPNQTPHNAMSALVCTFAHVPKLTCVTFVTRLEVLKFNAAVSSPTPRGGGGGGVL